MKHKTTMTNNQLNFPFQKRRLIPASFYTSTISPKFLTHSTLYCLRMIQHFIWLEKT